MEPADLAAWLIQRGFASRHFATASELAQLLSELEAGAPCVWRCEEAVDFQLQCVSCFGVGGLRVSVGLAEERPEEAPEAGAILRDCRISHRYSRSQLAGLLLHAGMESPLIESREDLADILEYMERGALCPFLGREGGSFDRALHEVLSEDCASAIVLVQTTDLLRQILPKYW
jgi:hypothetical protein